MKSELLFGFALINISDTFKIDFLPFTETINSVMINPPHRAVPRVTIFPKVVTGT